MIKTLDNKNAKRGDIVWEVGITLNGIYKPTRGVVYSKTYVITNEDKCWVSYEECLNECDKLNSKI